MRFIHFTLWEVLKGPFKHNSRVREMDSFGHLVILLNHGQSTVNSIFNEGLGKFGFTALNIVLR